MNETSIPAFPLQWPVSVPRTSVSSRQRSKFAQKPWNDSLKELRKQLKMLGAQREVISTNQPIRQDGEPYSQPRRIDDPGVAVYFILDGQQVCFPCDRFPTIAENFRAITLHIDSMRAQQRYGVGTAQQAFAGYKALPATTEENWWDVLGIRRVGATREAIQTAFRALATTAHPDHNGGDGAPMARLNGARERAFAEVH